MLDGWPFEGRTKKIGYAMRPRWGRGRREERGGEGGEGERRTGLVVSFLLVSHLSCTSWSCSTPHAARPCTLNGSRWPSSAADVGVAVRLDPGDSSSGGKGGGGWGEERDDVSTNKKQEQHVQANKKKASFLT